MREIGPRGRPLVLAHRGASRQAPENTLAAFALAARLGADGIELDVRLAADGVPVVIHDATLERTTSGRGRVSERTAAELSELDAGSWFGPAFAGERIPRLEEVLTLARTAELWLNVELKVDDPGAASAGVAPGGPPDPVELLAGRVVDALRSAGLEGRTVISSFSDAALRAVKARAPGLPCALLLGAARLSGGPPAWELAQELGVEGIHPWQQATDAELVARCRALGLAVRPWTVNDPVRARELASWGVSGLITDVPDRVLAALEQP